MELLLIIATLCNATAGSNSWGQQEALKCQKYYINCLKKQSLGPYEYGTTYAREKLVKCIEGHERD